MPPPTHSARQKLRGASVEKSPPSPQEIYDEIVHQLHTLDDFKEWVYEGIEPDDGDLICHSLLSTGEVESKRAFINFNSVTKALWVRAFNPLAVQTQWMQDALWQTDLLSEKMWDRCLIYVGRGTTHHGFSGPYLKSCKRPDGHITVNSDSPLVVEGGWENAWPRIQADKDLWIYGTTSTHIVILLKWSKTADDKVQGVAEVWRRLEGKAVLDDELVIFPEPVPTPDPARDRIGFTQGLILGSMILEDQDPDVVIYLEMAKLRKIARKRLERQRLTIA
ncbi:hypothetical protein BO70DRAFT_134172 [Aspergillus heteromorphus CBS 117.55]|uniref:Uncharacterized protein n=1 Tax=Aspergillus heteromorphus CBS 117.55 TaxID=1448321 RepID=A0A317WXQ0_9EURO|nr:uncharacterized protein BO70DRAFT_134172 [Aspergillus heteromorphus CBS 117.55]PWY90102.1 hypothetical protein BO70DRAFT_134172 [Aspergillus heteromorphus CBS 117.55]